MGEAQGKPSRHKSAKTAQKTGGGQSARETQRDQNLRWAYAYVHSVQVTDNLKLGAMKDIIDHLERLRQVVLGSGSFRDSEKHKMVRDVLHGIHLKTEGLKTLVAMKEAAGEVDDGGDAVPSKRPNICNAKDVADDEFVTEIGELCNALDAVRKAFATRKLEEAAVFEVVGRMTSIKSKVWYADPNTSWRIYAVLNEEKRWVTKEIAARAARGEPVERIANILDMWMGDDFDVDPDNDATAVRETALREAYEVAMGIVANSSSTLSALHTGYDRMQLYKGRLESLLPISGPPFMDRVYALLAMYDIKIQLIWVLSKQRETEGDVDDGGDVPPTRRVNICSRIEEYNVEASIKAEIKEICAKLDRMREVLLRSGDVDAELSDIVGRVNALKALPGYAEMPIAGGIEFVIAEECRWAENHWDDENDRLKEVAMRFTTAVPTAPPPSVVAVVVDPAQNTLKVAEAKKAAQGMTVESSFNLNALAERLDLADSIRDKVLTVGAPQREQVDAALKEAQKKWEELHMLSEVLLANATDEEDLNSEAVLGSQAGVKDNFSSKLEMGVVGEAEPHVASVHQVSLGAKISNPVSEPVLDSLDAENGKPVSELGTGALRKEKANRISGLASGPQVADEGSVTSADIMAAPCVGLDSYDLDPDVHAEFEEICGEWHRSRSMLSDDDASSENWTRAIGDLARRFVALFEADPRLVSHFLLMLAQERSSILREIGLLRAAPGGTSDANADVSEVADVDDAARQELAQRRSAREARGARADASAEGADDAMH